VKVPTRAGTHFHPTKASRRDNFILRVRNDPKKARPVFLPNRKNTERTYGYSFTCFKRLKQR
jgi:hypothetical protein